ncbi:MAG: PP2C family protein-serine/threonine phosphatase [Prolixibacteraceae bacterium]|nr:PP2C family protein-serine/threonine phosphatase [Prolixibacteraceae bacterium]
MRNRKLAYRLNFFHLLHFSIVLAITFLAVFFISNHFIKNRSIALLQQQIIKVDETVTAFCSDFDFYVDYLSLNRKVLHVDDTVSREESPFVIRNKNKIKSIAHVSGYSNPSDSLFLRRGFYWKRTQSNGTPAYKLQYQHFYKSGLKTVFEIDTIRLKKEIENAIIGNAGFPLLMNKDGHTLLFTENNSFIKPNGANKDKNFLEKISKGFTRFIETKIKGRQTYIAHNHQLNCYVVLVNNPNHTHFTLLIILVIIGIFLLGSFQIIITNQRQTKPLGNLIKYLYANSNQGIKLKGNELSILKNRFEQLQNQVKVIESSQEKISLKNSKLENDLKLAKKLQHNLMPNITPAITSHDEFEIYALSESAYDVGGDLYDYFLLDDENLLLAVADVSGKGIPASLYMIYTHTLLRNIAKTDGTVSGIMKELNNRLIDENISDMFVTFFLGMLNLKNGKFQYCNAAHNAPLVIFSEGRIEELSDIHGIPLGIYAKQKYKSSVIDLQRNDQIFIYSDGVTDSVDENGIKFAVDVLKYNLMGAWFNKPREVVMKIKKSIDDFRGNLTPEDDVTILTVQFCPDKKTEIPATNLKS